MNVGLGLRPWGLEWCGGLREEVQQVFTVIHLAKVTKENLQVRFSNDIALKYYTNIQRKWYGTLESFHYVLVCLYIL